MNLEPLTNSNLTFSFHAPKIALNRGGGHAPATQQSQEREATSDQAFDSRFRGGEFMKRVLTVAVLAACAAALAGNTDPIQLSASPTPLGGNGGTAGSTLIYDNTAGSIFSSGVQPRRALDDVSFNPGPAAGGAVNVDGINIGFVVTTANTAFDIRFVLYDDLDGTASPVNTNPYSPSYTFSMPNTLAAGAYVTGMVSLGTPIAVDDDALAIDILFLQPGTENLSTAATHLFAGGGVLVGSSADVYWRDANGNSQYDSSDARNFGGGANLANFYLQMTPEPASAALLALGALVVARRRR